MARSSPKYSYLDEWKRMWEPDLEAIAFNGATCDPTRVDPKVLQWVKQHCAQKPHFIKVIIQSAIANRPGRGDCKLVVPAPFVQQHFRKLERVVKLENEDGETWKVAFGIPTRHPAWRQGWLRFASDNNLKVGDVIVFLLVGNSHFQFTHFDDVGNTTNHNSTAEIAAVKNDCTSDSSQSHEDSIWKAEDEHVKTRASNLKPAPPLLSKKDQCTEEEAEFHEYPRDELVIPGLGFDHRSHVASQRCGPSDKQIEDPPSRKRRRLCKEGEKLKECFAHDFEKGGRTSMAGNASNSTIVTTLTPCGEENVSGADFGNSRHSSSIANN